MKRKHIQHLYWRAGFGLNNSEISELEKKSKTKIIKNLFKEANSFEPLKIDLSEYDVLLTKKYGKLIREMGKENVKKLAQKSKREVITLNKAWLDRLYEPSSVLREKMTLFWANVFVCKDQNIWNIQKYNNTLRANSLGNFRTFVKAVAHEPSMLNYLNNKQNKKAHPNENFARELMELFTLGVGNYTEQDIKESARAFTGWTFKKRGGFFLDKKNHDNGEKTFFGKKGNWNGDDIIDIILEQQQCARYICSRIYTYFINPKIDSERLEKLTEIFYKDYDIEKLMTHIYSSKWFYEEHNIGVKIKSPIELLVGMYQIVPHTLSNKNQTRYLQTMMGQMLLNPVNVSGWKGGTAWIDANTMMFRLKLPSVLLNNALINLDEKGDIEGTFEQFYKRTKKRKKFLQTTTDWKLFESSYADASNEILKNDLILSKIHPDTEALLKNLTKTSKKDFCIQLMSIPEYQLC